MMERKDPTAMTVVKCSNNKHYYDADLYPECPFCKQVESVRESDLEVTQILDSFPQEEAPKPVAKPITAAPQSTFPRPAPIVEPEQKKTWNPPWKKGKKSPTQEPPSLRGEISRVAGPAPQAPAVQSAPQEEVTQSLYGVAAEPVVGWLVATEGPHFGADFRLKTGRNFIGRSNTVDIDLSSDLSVSRENPAAVVLFDSRNSRFLLQAGTSKELCYLNGELVLETATLNPHDVLEIGNTRLLFVPLCGSAFCWENQDRKGTGND